MNLLQAFQFLNMITEDGADYYKELKQKQLEVILKNNPASDDYHAWVRSTKDILTFEEALNLSDYIDYKGEDFDESYPYSIVEEALVTGRIIVYSSYPIKSGIFVTPSRLEAKSYAGSDKIYSKEVLLTDVAWLDPTQGIFTGSMLNNIIEEEK